MPREPVTYNPDKSPAMKTKSHNEHDQFYEKLFTVQKQLNTGASVQLSHHRYHQDSTKSHATEQDLIPSTKADLNILDRHSSGDRKCKTTMTIVVTCKLYV